MAKNATLCPIFEAKMITHISYGLSMHYNIVILKIPFLRNFSSLSI